jgi:predicted outer membrane repeat protein
MNTHLPFLHVYSVYLFLTLFISTAAFSITRYVDVNSSSPTYPYTSWSTAATVIQDAVDACSVGDLVLVTNGLYDTGTRVTPGYAHNNRLLITNAITVSSVNGPAVTIIKGQGPVSSSGIRCAFISNNVVMIGFTFNNGHARSTGDPLFDMSAGGVFMHAGCMLSNCIINGCEIDLGDYTGGGAGILCFYGGTVIDCGISGNEGYIEDGIIYGGGIYCHYGGSINTSTITGNSLINDYYSSCSLRGGGIGCHMGGSLSNCMIANNQIYFDDQGTTGSGGGVQLDNADMIDCIVIANRVYIYDYGYGYGGGVYCYESTLRNCMVTGNYAYAYQDNAYGGGIAGDYVTLVNCTVSENVVEADDYARGGGIYIDNGSLQTCLVAENRAEESGGGIYAAAQIDMVNCTVSRNHADEAGGIYNTDSAVQNSVIYYNTATIENNYSNTGSSWSYEYSCAPGLSGTGCITNTPQFVNMPASDYHLLSTSPCVNAGNNAYVSSMLDLDGNPRILGGTVDMGCYELPRNPSLLPPAITNPVQVASAEAGSFIAQGISYVTISGPKNVNTWVLQPVNGEAFKTNGIIQSLAGTEWQTTVPVSTADGNKQEYEFKAGNADLSEISAASTFLAILTLYTPVHYVSLTGGNVWPYTNWADAALTIQDAADAAVSYDTVLVADGIYENGGTVPPGYALTCRVAVAEAVLVRSVNGPQSTVILGNGPRGSYAVRCAYLGPDAVLSGFTLSNGHTAYFGDYQDTDGGGAFLEPGSILTNCIVSGCEAYSGGGIWCHYGGSVYSCIVDGNRAGGSYGDGGGILCYYGGYVSGCTISRNSAQYDGGGVKCYAGEVNRSVVNNNFSWNDGGGIHCNAAGQAKNCVVFGNETRYRGGGIYLISAGTYAYNCLVYDNRVEYYGGGIYCVYGYVINCTVTRNDAFGTSGSGGGIYMGNQTTNINSIVYHNTCRNTSQANWYSLGTLEYTCTTPLPPSGQGNHTNDPQFADQADDDFHLLSSSPCVNTGSNIYSFGSFDLDGLPRILDGTVDMGVYEQSRSDALYPPEIIAPTGVEPGEWEEYVTHGMSHIVISGNKPADHWVLSRDNHGGFFTNGIAQSYSGTTWSHTVLLLAFDGARNEFAYKCRANSLFEASLETTRLTIYSLDTPVHYVSHGGAAVWPYTNWIDAAQNIQDAVDAAAAYDRVMVDDGVFDSGCRIYGSQSLSSRVVVTKPIQVESLHGPDHSFIVGRGQLGPDAVRGVVLAGGAVLEGFTISNGYTHLYDTGGGSASPVSNGDDYPDYSGGGVFIDQDGVLRDCIVIYNVGDRYGGGICCWYGGTVEDCEVIYNTSYYYGGGICCYFGGDISYSYIADNRGENHESWDSLYGGGLACYYGGTVRHCYIAGNSADTGSDGYIYGAGVNCYRGTLSHCFIAWNGADDPEVYGGGVDLGEAYMDNCLVYNNYLYGDTSEGGGVHMWNSVMNNCTIVNNVSDSAGGGVFTGYNSTNINCIIYYNTCHNDPGSSNWFDYASVYAWCCLMPDHAGPGNITNEPQFVDMGDQNYHLWSTSPCINAGTNDWQQLAVSDYDLDHAPRILDGIVDMGCFEQAVSEVIVPPAVISPISINAGDYGVITVTNRFNIWIEGTKSGGYYTVTVDDYDAWVTNSLHQALSGTTWSNRVELGMNPFGEWNEFEYTCASEEFGKVSDGITAIDVVNYYVDFPPYISSAALIFPSSNSMIYISEVTNVIWEITGIHDEFDQYDLAITEMAVHRAAMPGVIGVVTTYIENTLGTCPWHVPADMVSPGTYCVLEFTVEDSGGNTNSMVFTENPFMIVPEALGAWFLLLVLTVLRKLNHQRRFNL